MENEKCQDIRIRNYLLRMEGLCGRKEEGNSEVNQVIFEFMRRKLGRTQFRRPLYLSTKKKKKKKSYCASYMIGSKREYWNWGSVYTFIFPL
jgi:hypothetical protein